MTRMRAVDAIALILAKEGATQAFGVPGAAINPLYSAMRAHGGIRHVLARHVEAASHMAEGFSRVGGGRIGVCIGTSGPGGTDMVTGMYSASADSVPILCLTGQAAVPMLHNEEFQAVDIAAVAAPVTKMAVTVLEAAQVPGIMAKAFQLMRSGRPGPVLVDLPLDVQVTVIEFDIDAYQPLPVERPAMSAYQAERVLDMLDTSRHPLLVCGGGVISAEAADDMVALAEYLGVPVVSTLMGWGAVPDDHRLAQGLVGIQTSQRYANATFLESDLVIGIGNRWASRHTGDLETYRGQRRFVHVDIEPTQVGRVFPPDLWSVSDAGTALRTLLQAARQRYSAPLERYGPWVQECQERKRTLLRRTHFDEVPMKPQRVYEEMCRAFGPETRYVTTIGLSQIAAAQMLHVYRPRHWVNASQASPLGWTLPAAIGACVADPATPVVALSGDYDFQFHIEELAVAAQFQIPYVHVVVNNAYLGLIRQAQRAFDMDYQVQLSFANINAPQTQGYGVDHVGVAEALGCRAVRAHTPEELAQALSTARQTALRDQVPVVVEAVLERVTNISMGTSLDAVNEFEPLAHDPAADAPLAVALGATAGAVPQA
ncbi:glyoxylate carboligase [Actinomyces wuliandei]|uniref:glyoxylate carboligase n=1 Tax=Actinomyces wuliandei TaxID=2057743 RepID=UPI000FDC5652|nr:glyoxylate carboligase [Actinomyces wuliandei]